MNQTLDVSKAFADIRSGYENDPRRDTFNLLLCGEMGTGKTHILKTARKPVLGHFFDPGGEKTLAKEIKEGTVLPETFAPDDPFHPWAFTAWEKRMKEIQRSGIMNHIGTYCLDSSTMWADSILNHLTAKRGAAGKTPDGKIDYIPQKTEIKNWISVILGFPCDCIVTGHLEPTEDQVSGRTTYRYATTGKGTIIIPAMFDEVFVAIAEDHSKGVNWKIQTAGAGRYAARTRLGAEGKLEQFEKPDIKAILKKVGRPTDDKPIYKP